MRPQGYHAPVRTGVSAMRTRSSLSFPSTNFFLGTITPRRKN